MLGFGRTLCVVLVGLGAASFTSANGVHNAGITWGSVDTIEGANVDGSGRHVVFPRGYDEEGDPAWTRDGRGLAFVAALSDTVQIFVMWPGTRSRVLGSGSSRSREPTWSPDAKRIAVSEGGSFGSSTGPLASTIMIVSLATNKWTSVTKPRRHRSDIDPAWSPDGRTIAFARRLHDGTPTLYLVHPDGSALRQLTKGRSPSWSPDGKRLAFALGGSIYEIRADGGGRKRILRGLSYPLVRWSPDGRKLLYTSEKADVWTGDVDGTHRRRILHRVVIDGIAWRPGS